MPTTRRRRRRRGTGSGPASGRGSHGGGGGEGRQHAGATRTPDVPAPMPLPRQPHLSPGRPLQSPSIDSGGSSSESDNRWSWQYGADSGSSSDVDIKWKTMITMATSSRSANPPRPPSASVPATKPVTSSVQERKRRRRRDMASTSSRLSLPDQSSSKMPPPQLDAGKSSEAAAAAADIASSEFSSPIHRPKPLLLRRINSNGDVDYVYNSDQEAADVYHRDYLKYQKERACLEQLPMFKQSVYHRNIIDWHDLRQKNAALDVAESMLSLSSSSDGKAIDHCNGFIIEHDKVHGSAVIVTSSQIICTKKSLDDWKDNNVYSPDAKVIAHLWDGTSSELQLLYFNRHYEIAFYSLNGGQLQKVAPLDPNFRFGTEACVLARDKDLELICRRTVIKALDPCEHQRNHYLFIDALKCEGCSGGALANFDGSILGMVLYARPNVAFLPSSIILKCFKLWKRFRKLARPNLGVRLRTVGFLDISHLDNLSRIYGVRSGLIVAKFEDMLLDVCENQFEKGTNVNSKVDIELGVYNVRKRARRNITLSVELSDGMEVIDEGLWDD